MRKMNRFANALESGRWIVTAECQPPRGADYGTIETLASAIPDGLDAVVVSDNQDAIRGSAFSAAVMLARGGASVVMSMATRDRNRIALMSDALGAAALNVDAILCTSGNHQSLGVCPAAAAAFDFDSVQFTHTIKKAVLYGGGFNGTPMAPKLELQVGATIDPYLLPIELNLMRLKKKIVAGADFLLTQPVFDVDGFSLWLESACKRDFDKRTAIIVSVLPITSLERADALQNTQIYGAIPESIFSRIRNAADPSREGMAIAVETAVRLKGMQGIRGVHILSGGSALIEESMLAVRQLTAVLKG
jgi:methylenetetrahydrofolate reductase (NADPH)